MSRDPTPTQMLYEGAHDAIEALIVLRRGLVKKIIAPCMIEMIDNQVFALEYAIEAHEKEKGL